MTQPHAPQRLQEPKKEVTAENFDKTRAQREWKHILIGAMALAATAGYANAVVLDFFDTPISHMSGAVSKLSSDIARQEAHSMKSLLVIFGFVLGTIMSGIFIGDTKVLPSRRCGAIMMLESVLLLTSAFLLDDKSVYGPMMAAIACGLQNGMTTSYCGLMIRTTHVTGLVTDIGLMIGQWIRRRDIEGWKLNFHLGILVSFFGGGVLGTWLGIEYGHWCLAFAAIVTFCLGFIFFTVMQVEVNARSAKDNRPYTGIFSND